VAGPSSSGATSEQAPSARSHGGEPLLRLESIAGLAAATTKGAAAPALLPRTAPFAPLLAGALAVSLMGGCGSAPKRDTSIDRQARAERPAPGSRATAPRAPRGGGYYLDDGPGESPPPNLDTIPEPIPQLEPLRRANMRPYVVLGQSFTPMTELQPYRAQGVATWYGRRYHGRQTSSGEPYDMYAISAAHPTLPIPSYARVTNLANGRSVVVRINDRGPFLENRLIDLSYTAAHRIGVLAGGSAMVEVEALIPDGSAPTTGLAVALRLGTTASASTAVAARASPQPSPAAPVPVTRPPAPVAYRPEPVPQRAPAPAGASAEAARALAHAAVYTDDPILAIAAAAREPLAAPVPLAADRGELQPAPAAMASAMASAAPRFEESRTTGAADVSVIEGMVYLQLGAFGSRENAESYLARTREQLESLAQGLQVVPRDGLFRVHAGPYTSPVEARLAAERIALAIGVKPVVVPR
jgi:rare lipoprotein A